MQRQAQRGLVSIALVAICTGLFGGAACDRSQQQAADDTPTPETTAPPSPCEASALEPSYLSEDVEPTDEDALFAAPERTRTWEGRDLLVQLLEDFKADHGDDPDLRKTSVRGDDNANITSMDSEMGDLLVVDWAEDTRCGITQYAVATIGLS